MVVESDFRAGIVAAARRYVGTPYLHQGSDECGCDCIGLACAVWRAMIGPEPEAIGPYCAVWRDPGGTESLLAGLTRHMRAVPTGAMRPGDLVVFRWRSWLPARHCAILVDAERIVHAYQSAGKVAEGALHRQWRQRIAGVFAFPEPLATAPAPSHKRAGL